jgi:hypothetical protein
MEDMMTAKDLTKRDLLLQQRAARLMERTLPDQIRRAYDDTAGDERDRACAALVARGQLTEEELTTLPLEEAITVALGRVRAETARLNEQSVRQGSEHRGRADTITKPPRTLRRG